MPSTRPNHRVSLGRPTAVRWRVLALLMAFAAICHFNRVSMSVAGTERIIGETVSATQMGTVYSAYLLAYTLVMVPAGWLIDRRGPRWTLTLMALSSASLVALTGAAASTPHLLVSLIVVRGMLGVASAPLHPAAAQTVSFWFPAGSQPLANGLVTAAAVVGVATTYLAFGWLIDWCGWPWAFVITGSLTALLALVWIFVARDRPGEHPAVNAAELAITASAVDFDRPAAVAAYLPDNASVPLLCDRRLWLLTLSYGALGYFQYLLFYWQEYYFEDVLLVEKQQARWFATVTTLAMALGMIVGGWLAARLQQLTMLRVPRFVVPAAGLAASGLLAISGVACRDPHWVLAMLSLAMASAGLSEGSFWTTVVDVGGRSGGLAAAIMNSGGNLGGAISPVVTPLLAAHLGWQGGMAVASAFCLLAAVCWFWIVTPEGD